MIDWQHIDTVLLDMDGTLLDLHFDNYFWLTHLPRRYAEAHGVDLDTAHRQLAAQYRAHEGTLQWYCLEHWSDFLKIDIVKLKHEVKDKIQVRPFVSDFLQRLQALDKKLILITNAHPQSLDIKLEITSIDRWLDMVISSHEFQEPKEAQAFWHQLQQREHFDKARTLFIDDTLRVLRSAERFGIAHLLCIHQPDSRSEHRQITEYPAIDHFDEIMPPPAPEQSH
ncbi:GMP/IMP nucleotidase [Exilibacterium tricleocarpae]|uniref:GMP/IMP nucleotidase n=1 Tax=Exilibacterium tricleocarpae TaxID=2591008 RepID=A0A545TKB2_9GAMM|nr:GMP/IMP nucleotidase [Exilibacterium tricleocarpae]TQV77655.1 GMP/IMP nucleotidase [Exilibacterium tricleocarpae]